jgi:hypothetical protein
MFEDGVPPRFRLRAINGSAATAQASSIETVTPRWTRQLFAMGDKGGFLESRDPCCRRCCRIAAFDRRPAVNRPGIPTPIGELSYCRAVEGCLLEVYYHRPLAHDSRRRNQSFSGMTVLGVRRGKAALSSGCKPHPATAPAGSNRSSHGGNEVAEAFD